MNKEKLSGLNWYETKKFVIYYSILVSSKDLNKNYELLLLAIGLMEWAEVEYFPM